MFYSSLSNEKKSDNEYEHIIQIGNTFQTISLRDYHDLYLQLDVLLSAKLSLKFRKISLRNYALCLSPYSSAPDLS